MKSYFNSFNFVYNRLINEASDFYLNKMGGTSETKAERAECLKKRDHLYELSSKLTQTENRFVHLISVTELVLQKSAQEIIEIAQKFTQELIEELKANIRKTISIT